MATIIKTCFTKESAADNVRTLCNRMLKAFLDYSIGSMDYNKTMGAFAITQPKVFLDVFLGEISSDDYFIKRLFSVDHTYENPMKFINNDTIIHWCEINPKIRYYKIASAITPFHKNGKENLLKWPPLALKVIEYAPEPTEVLNKLDQHLNQLHGVGRELI